MRRPGKLTLVFAAGFALGLGAGLLRDAVEARALAARPRLTIANLAPTKALVRCDQQIWGHAVGRPKIIVTRPDKNEKWPPPVEARWWDPDSGSYRHEIRFCDPKRTLPAGTVFLIVIQDERTVIWKYVSLATDCPPCNQGLNWRPEEWDDDWGAILDVLEALPAKKAGEGSR